MQRREASSTGRNECAARAAECAVSPLVRDARAALASGAALEADRARAAPGLVRELARVEPEELLHVQTHARARRERLRHALRPRDHPTHALVVLARPADLGDIQRT